MKVLYDSVLLILAVLCPLVFIALLLLPAPYGRYRRSGWGPGINAKMGWILMELPSATIFALFFFFGKGLTNVATICFFVMWQTHYTYRTFIFPLRIRSDHSLPFVILLSGAIFNIANAFTNGYYLNFLASPYSSSWLYDPRFLGGVILFFVGMAIHVQSDSILIRLRGPKKGDYKIPYGGLFKWISCPNYFGELVQWIGFALATWSLPGLVFACFTAANLVPRALTHHRHYQQQFANYPDKRRAIIPFVL